MGSLLLVVGLTCPWAGAAVVASLRRQHRRALGRLTFAFVVLSACALAGAWLGTDHAGDLLRFRVPWIPSMGISLALRLDRVSLPFTVNVLLVALGAIAYGWGYFQDTGRLHLCYALILAFVGSMLGVVLAEDAILLFVFWESMLVASSLLLAGWGEGDAVGYVTLKYFLYTQVGSLMLLASIIYLISLTGTSSLPRMATKMAAVPGSRLVWVAALMLVGFGIKLAIAPLHIWLPDAHAIAPMPVTILLAAAMLAMGAYGILRLPLMTLGPEVLARLQLPLLLVAIASQVYGGLMCLASRDIKRIVAYSSVSQMGYVLFGLATLTPQGVTGSVFHIINHGIIKALLFMCVGMVMRGTGRRNIDQLGGLWRGMTSVAVCLLLATIAMAGVPPFSAFHSEWLILSAGLSSGYPIVGLVAFGGPLLTAAYGLWLSTRIAFGPEPSGLAISSVPAAMRWSAYVFITLSLVIGIFPGPVYDLARGAAVAALGGGSP